MPVSAASAPISSFSVSTEYNETTVIAVFTDTSLYVPTAWLWTFTNVTGNNTPIQFSTLQNTAGIFGFGNWLIELNASNSEGYSKYTQFVNMTAVEPVSIFGANQTSGYRPFTVQFYDISTGNPTGRLWDFGDGSNSTVQNPIHTYFLLMNYTVTLNVTNVLGFNNTSIVDYIRVYDAPVPGTNFTGTPLLGYVGTDTQFTDTSTNSPTAWNWSFGDGSYSELQNPDHVYSTNGTFSVALNASNSYGYSVMTRPYYVTIVSPVPVANFSATPRSGYVGTTVTFTDLSTLNPTSWNWSFGDGNYSNAQNPTHTYNVNGSFRVTFTATNSYGSNTSSIPDYVAIGAPVPVANFTSNITQGNPSFAVKFTDTSTNSPTSWSWDFGDGNTSTDQNPVNIYGAIGTYNVALTATNSYGSNTTTKYNYIGAYSNGRNKANLYLTPLFQIVLSFQDTNGNNISAVTVLDHTGNSTTTTNGTFTGYYPTGVAAFYISASGYVSQSNSYILDSNRSIVVQLMKAPAQSQIQMVNTNTVRFVCQNYNGNPIVGMNVSAVAVSSTMPDSWVPALFGIDLGSTALTNTTMSGTTGHDGGITFVMLPTSKYRVWYNAPAYGINETRYYYPQETEYIETFWTQAPTYASSGIITDFYTYKNESNGTITLGVVYNDTFGSTDNLTFTVMNGNRTIIYQTWVTPA
jgi:PKD repeat protein